MCGGWTALNTRGNIVAAPSWKYPADAAGIRRHAMSADEEFKKMSVQWIFWQHTVLAKIYFDMPKRQLGTMKV